MIPLAAGSLIHRITLQTITEVNTSGQIIPTPSTVGEYWAFVEPLSGRELVAAQAVSSDITHRITMRHNGLDIKHKDRILFGDRVLNVASALNVEESDDRWVILAVEDVE